MTEPSEINGRRQNESVAPIAKPRPKREIDKYRALNAPYLDQFEAAYLIGVGITKFNKDIRKDIQESVVGKIVRFDRADILAYMAAHKIGGIRKRQPPRTGDNTRQSAQNHSESKGVEHADVT